MSLTRKQKRIQQNHYETSRQRRILRQSEQQTFKRKVFWSKSKTLRSTYRYFIRFTDSCKLHSFMFKCTAIRFHCQWTTTLIFVCNSEILTSYLYHNYKLCFSILRPVPNLQDYVHLYHVSTFTFIFIFPAAATIALQMKWLVIRYLEF